MAFGVLSLILSARDQSSKKEKRRKEKGERRKIEKLHTTEKRIYVYREQYSMQTNMKKVLNINTKYSNNKNIKLNWRFDDCSGETTLLVI